ncbi:hypothetical protein GCG54_00007276 [Colletotrichum gloeosporioides]|uniref:AB hydrolase-1 domain-containing protein n=2 Tax=Colletotrichum gloeosporioides TaxID=474922 RepID=T0KHA6_COLGC|nr:uncharacterized protein GCG54_00007276 [Colletotrichum gloeosporioides]EQB52323.1 hypothetical protein CGLO_08052 [Colletotrichum gloeosporioides Cg-14]KAF3807021.1 hypothetical protein GCG54_00007276 [Colletotrichum gloeosporioides]
MPTPSKAVLLVTGAWHVPQHYQKLIDRLEAEGVRVICEQLPTNNNAVPPNKTLEDDVNSIRSIAQREALAGTHLTVIAHSYGGVIATAALADYAITPDSNKGGVADIIYMTAFIPPENTSLAGIFGGSLPPFLLPQPDGTMTWTDPIGLLYNDIPIEEAESAKNLMVTHGHKAQYTPISCSKAAWRVLPLTYIICENDQALPSVVQEMMIKKVEDEGIAVKKHRLPGSHSPFMSMPDKVATIVLSVMG